MRIAATAVCLSLAVAGGVHAKEQFPSQPITIVVPNPPGGMNQITAQPLSVVMEKITGQPVVVVNKPGGTGAVGTAYVANQKPDGTHLLVTTPNLYLVIEKNKALHVESPYRLDQIQPVALTSADPLIFVVQAESPYHSLKDFVSAARSKPGEMAFSSSGPYGITHVPMEMFLHAAKLKLRHVPTTGGGPAIVQLLGGHVQATGGGVAAVKGHIAAGKLRALASWGAKRHPALPDVPTFKELGYDAEAYLWVGLFTTAGLPAGTLKALRKVVEKTIHSADYQDAMKKSNVVIDYRDTPQFVKFFKEDHARLAKVVKRIAAEEKK